MGRCYCGDIEGKFWFGIQNSDDISALVSHYDPLQPYIWKSCGCDVDVDVPETEKYCKTCFSSKNQHIETVEDEGDYEDGLLYFEGNSIVYNLDKDSHYQELVDNMNTLKQSIPKCIIAEFDNIEQTDKILNAFTGVFDKTHPLVNKVNDDFVYSDSRKKELAGLVARYTLGFQIEYCLRNNSFCVVQCEI